MPKIILMRHGRAVGNSPDRYIGSGSDVPLCDEGRKAAMEKAAVSSFPKAEAYYCSPLLRTRQTFRIFFPGIEPQLEPMLRECDYGRFEGRSFYELRNDPDYILYCEQGLCGRFPGGESLPEFRARCVKRFREIAKQTKDVAIIVTHGGVISSVLSEFSEPKGAYMDYLVTNCGTVVLNVDCSQDELKVTIESVAKRMEA